MKKTEPTKRATLLKSCMFLWRFSEFA